MYHARLFQDANAEQKLAITDGTDKEGEESADKDKT